jgi:hypothetical protein
LKLAEKPATLWKKIFEQQRPKESVTFRGNILQLFSLFVVSVYMEMFEFMERL